MRIQTSRPVVMVVALALSVATLAAQGLSGRVEPLSDQHRAQINRFRTPSPTARVVAAGQRALPLLTKPKDFSSLRYRIDDQRYSIDDFMTRTHVSGLLVLKNGEIVQERY